MANIHTPIPNLKLNDGTSIPMVSVTVTLLPGTDFEPSPSH
jgi:hypothetical protein